jgi:hypothetical protein
MERHLPWIFTNWPMTAGWPDTLDIPTPDQKTSFQLDLGSFVWGKK